MANIGPIPIIGQSLKTPTPLCGYASAFTHEQQHICFILNDVFVLDDEDDEDKNESCTKPLSSKVDDLQTCNDLVAKHGTALQKAISELQDLNEFQNEDSELAKRLKVVNEKATLFRITSSAMISVSIYYYYFH